MLKRIIYVLAILAPVFAQQVSPTINQFPSRQFGQPSLPAPGQGVYNISPNLVEGRELWTPFGIAIDTNATPPILYVADTGNNRVLVWKNANSLSVCGLNNPGCGFADIPIGQRDMYTTLAAGPGRNGGGLSIGFTSPMALAVDANGNLYVADVGNNRILRFPSPTKQNGSLLQPDLVIGQKTANSGIQPNEGNQVPSAKTLSLQSGLVTSMAFDSSGGLWVPDPGNNRVLRFPANQLTAGTIEPAADIVMGQLDFQTSSEMQAPAGTFGRRHRSEWRDVHCRCAQPGALLSAGNRFGQHRNRRVENPRAGNQSAESARIDAAEQLPACQPVFRTGDAGEQSVRIRTRRTPGCEIWNSRHLAGRAKPDVGPDSYRAVLAADDRRCGPEHVNQQQQSEQGTSRSQLFEPQRTHRGHVLRNRLVGGGFFEQSRSFVPVAGREIRHGVAAGGPARFSVYVAESDRGTRGEFLHQSQQCVCGDRDRQQQHSPASLRRRHQQQPDSRIQGRAQHRRDCRHGDRTAGFLSLADQRRNKRSSASESKRLVPAPRTHGGCGREPVRR